MKKDYFNSKYWGEWTDNGVYYNDKWRKMIIKKHHEKKRIIEIAIFVW